MVVVLVTLFLDMIGFGIVIPVMPDLIVELTHVPVAQAAGYAGWLMGAFAMMRLSGKDLDAEDREAEAEASDRRPARVRPGYKSGVTRR